MSGHAEIKSVTRRGDLTVLVSVEVSSGEECESVELVLLDELFLSLEIDIGEIDGDMLCELEKYAEVTAAYMSACASFAYVQSSLGALYIKLVGKGFSKESSAEAVDIMRERGFVDETAIAVRRAELMLGKLWGRSRILHKLREERFPDSAIESVSLFLDNVDFPQNCARVIEKKYGFLPDERHDREKIYASLIRLGYSLADIKGAVNILSENE